MFFYPNIWHLGNGMIWFSFFLQNEIFLILPMPSNFAYILYVLNIMLSDSGHHLNPKEMVDLFVLVGSCRNYDKATSSDLYCVGCSSQTFFKHFSQFGFQTFPVLHVCHPVAILDPGGCLPCSSVLNACALLFKVRSMYCLELSSRVQTLLLQITLDLCPLQ